MARISFPDISLSALDPLPLVAIGLALVLVMLGVARRVPWLRALLSLGAWGAILALLAISLDGRMRFDPHFDRLAGLVMRDRQQVVGSELRIAMARDGHFWAKATIDGVTRRMLVDSGATLTALSPATAAAAGLEVADGVAPILLDTANGTIRARGATIADLRLGNITARGLSVVVVPGLGRTDVLGMNFLSRLKSWRVEGSTLILVPHHPTASPAT